MQLPSREAGASPITLAAVLAASGAALPTASHDAGALSATRSARAPIAPTGPAGAGSASSASAGGAGAAGGAGVALLALFIFAAVAVAGRRLKVGRWMVPPAPVLLLSHSPD